MTSLLIARSAYKTALETVPGIRVYTHGGMFTAKDLERYSRAAPCAVLSLLRFDPRTESGIVQATAYWGVVCVTKAEPGTPQDAGCIALAEACCIALLPVVAGEDGASTPTDMEGRNLFSQPLDAVGIAMWSLEWTQTLDLVQDIVSDEWTRFHASWDLYPRDNDAELGTILEAEDDVDPSA